MINFQHYKRMFLSHIQLFKRHKFIRRYFIIRLMKIKNWIEKLRMKRWGIKWGNLHVKFDIDKYEPLSFEEFKELDKKIKKLEQVYLK